MPDISLLEPVVLAGVVRKLDTPEQTILLDTVPKKPWPFPSVTWDIVTGARQMAKPNVPNAEAHIIPHLGRSQASASFAYTREKKVFEPTTLYWLREPGELARTNAEQAVTDELKDLSNRIDYLQEYYLWQALTGTLVIDTVDVQATVDYQFAASHLPSPGTNWSTATPVQIVADIRAWKRLVARDGRVPANKAYASEATLAHIFNSFASTGVANTFFGGTLLSDRMKDEYYKSGVLQGFMGLDWTMVETVYVDDNGVEQQYLKDDALVLGNFTNNQPLKMYEGPTADLSAPKGYTGKFTKTWLEDDPSGRQVLMESHFLPVITHPEQFVYVDDVTS